MTVKIQLRRDTSTNWALHNPVLAEGEIACELDTGFIKIGNGVDAWNSLSYARQLIHKASVLELERQRTPSAGVGVARLYNKDSLRSLVAYKEETGNEAILGSHPAYTNFQLLQVNGGNGFTLMGTTSYGVASGGTRTGLNNHIFPANVNYATNTQVGNAATIGLGSTNIYRAKTGEQGGFHAVTRFLLPDASYDGTSANTGSRFVLGLATADFPLADNLATVAGSYIGFKRVSNPGIKEETNFQLVTSTSGGASEIDTGLSFTAGCVYTAELLAPREENKIYWLIRNETTGAECRGHVSDNIPTLYTMHKLTMRLQNINAQSRNMGIISMYVESGV